MLFELLCELSDIRSDMLGIGETIATVFGSSLRCKASAFNFVGVGTPGMLFSFGGFEVPFTKAVGFGMLEPGLPIKLEPCNGPLPATECCFPAPKFTAWCCCCSTWQGGAAIVGPIVAAGASSMLAIFASFATLVASVGLRGRKEDGVCLPFPSNSCVSARPPFIHATCPCFPSNV